MHLIAEFAKRLFFFFCRALRVFLAFLFPSKFSQRLGRRKSSGDKKIFYHRQPKPAWVRKEIIRLKALMPEAGCRRIAYAFNRRFAQSKLMTVSKTLRIRHLSQYYASCLMLLSVTANQNLCGQIMSLSLPHGYSN